MEVKKIDENFIRIEIDDLTLANLLNENLWKMKVDFASYSREHPYLSKPQITVKGKNPKKLLLDAAEQIISDCKELQEQLKRI
jgi:DNA-directed RNA polymerase subunit L